MESTKKKHPFAVQKFSKILFSSTINLVLAFIKFPFLIIALSLSYAYNLFASFIPIFSLRRFISSLTSSYLFRIILGLTGIFSVKEQPTPLIDSYSETEDTIEPQQGDIIIANCASYLNLFWLQYKFSPIYVIPCDQTNAYIFNFYQLFASILSERKLTSKLKKPLSEVIKIASEKFKCPVVIFPEGSVTNGEFLINFMDFGKDIDTTKVQFHILGFVHDKSYISPNFVFGNGFLHLFSMSGRLFSKMKLKIALPQDTKSLQKNIIDKEWIEKCRYIMSKITHLSLFDIDGNDFDKIKENEFNLKHHYD